jgi:Zn-dependent protease with chaperone function
MPALYPGTAYAADGRGGARASKLTLNSSSLGVETQDGLSFQWNYRDLELSQTGEDGGFLLIKSSRRTEAFDGSLIAQDENFRLALAEKMGERERSFLLKFSKQHRRIIFTKWRNLVSAGAGSIVLFLGGYWALGHWAADFAAKHLPIPAEVAWGEVQAQTELAQRPAITEGPVVDAAQTILNRLAAAVPNNPGYPFQIHVVESPEVNAFALPGGQIFLLTGLVKKAQSPEEVAGVLAHEMQHVLHRHVVRRSVQQMGLTIWISVLFGHGTFSGLAQQAGKVLNLSFSRSQESEADLDGARLLARANLPIQPLEVFFTRLAQEQGAAGGKAMAFISDHPASLDRVQALRDLAKTIEPKSPQGFSTIDWKRVQTSLKN